MTDQPKNSDFHDSSFLQGANSAYVEQLYGQWAKDPSAVDHAWDAFFRDLGDNNGDAVREAEGASWKRADWPPMPQDDTTAALTGEWPASSKGAADAAIKKIAAKAEEKGVKLSTDQMRQAVLDSIRALMLIRAFRIRGHLHANLDPLGLRDVPDHGELKPETYGFGSGDMDRPIFIDNVLGLEIASIRQICDLMTRTYCGTFALQYMHISNPEEAAWLKERIEGYGKEIQFTREGRRAILNKLVEAEGFEKFLHVKYMGTKRFGLDGGESLIPAMEQIIKRGGALGVKDIVLGMPHRGRLNVLAAVMGKPYHVIFHEFQGGSSVPSDVEGSGDVKYHLGASSDREFDQNKVHLSLTANPSHLEIVDPVVMGKARAKQDHIAGRSRTEVVPLETRAQILPLLIHGDAAFAGQGVVAECFGLSALRGHRVAGTLHFIINNQIGFTTNPRFSRSSPYPSDVAKTVEAPIFHVNGDDPEAVVYAAKIAMEFRMKFHKPVVIDMFCYRRYGHNEGDEPAFTQPVMYKTIRNHPSTLEIYTKKLVAEGLLSEEDVEARKAEWRKHLDEEFEAGQSYLPNKADWLDGAWSGLRKAEKEDEPRRGITGVPLKTLKEMGAKLSSVPETFNVHRTVKRFLENRASIIDTGEGIDWATAEALAFGTLVTEGHPVRLSGQDVERGTFSQRHSVLYDQEDESRYIPLANLAKGQAVYEVINSMLSEEAVLGYEYGYSLAEPNALTLWEAQFGDFAN
ncbi:MAG: 2-oxoglutarate dehydrogenase E1 component, partial [Caulobacter sp.]|nr:2-oxoglutarate dehydrogenase E1 component [Caulobacter sp.]